MLVLTRKVGQSIVIGGEIVVVLLDVHGNQVKLGIDAPSSVSVHRSEIESKIRDAASAATAWNDPK